MRPGQNKRMRGRNNNNGGGNRKGPNPLTRSYESNGPDVKIRGTAQHIGEKYLQLARDAQTSGDPVAAESYLQHAEHYFRLIAAAQQAQFQAQSGLPRTAAEMESDEGDDDDDGIPDRFAIPLPQPVPQPQPQFQPQPQPDRQPTAERQPGTERQEGSERPYRQDRVPYDRGDQQRPQGQDRNQAERQGYDNRPNGDRPQRNDRPDNRQDRPDRQDRQFNNRNRFGRDGGDNRDGRDSRDMQYREQPRIPVAPAVPVEQPVEVRALPPQVDESGPELPAFITAPVRQPTPAIEPDAEAAPEPVAAAPVERPADAESADPAGESFAARPRRRRRTRVAAVSDLGQPEEPTPSSED